MQLVPQQTHRSYPTCFRFSTKTQKRAKHIIINQLQLKKSTNNFPYHFIQYLLH